MLKDLANGKNGESRVAAIFTNFGFTLEEVDKENRSFYDLKSTEPAFTVEVKNDVYSACSKNVAIEIFNCKSSKASGLTVTKSTLWAHIIEGKVYLTTTQKLKDFVANNKPVKTVYAAGDKNADIMLFAVSEILSIFTAEEDLTKEKILEMLV